MLKLCGFAASNYYNKVKIALLEKDIPFEESLEYPSQKEDYLVASPMGKVPFLRTDRGTLAESQAIIEYLEDAYPQNPLYPKDAFERAKVRELIQMIELHLELPARRLYGEAFFGGKASDEAKKEVDALLAKGTKAVARIARFEPYIAGKAFTYADCAAIVTLPLIAGVTKAVLGNDPLSAAIPNAIPYVKQMSQRPHVARVREDQKAGVEAYAKVRQSR